MGGRFYSKSLFCTTNLDIPPNSLVTVWKTNGTQVTGMCYANPKYTSDVSSIQLVNVTYDRIDEADMVGQRVPFMKIVDKEIYDLRVLQRAENPDREIGESMSKKVEKIVHTHVISTLQQLRQYIHAVQIFKVDKMALTLKGVNISRDGTLGWICILTEQMLLVCIDCKGKKRDGVHQDWWNIIDEEILSNEKIVKVVFNVRPMIDFLFHRLSLDMKSVFDVQMTDMFLYVTKQIQETKDVKSIPGVASVPQTLSQLVELAKLDVFPEELALMKAVEAQDYSVMNPLMNRPLVQCVEMKEVAISLRLMLALHKHQIDLFTWPLKDCAQAQINYMKSGCFMVSYEQAVEGQNYAPSIMHHIRVKLNKHLMIDTEKLSEESPNPEPKI